MNSDVKFYIALLLKRLPVMLVIFILLISRQMLSRRVQY